MFKDFFPKFPSFFLPFSFLAVLSGLAGYLLAPIEILYLDSILNSPTLIGILFGVSSVALGLFSLFLGRLSDKIGRVRIIRIGFIFAFAYPLVYALAYNFFSLLGAKLLWALAVASTSPLMYALLQDLLEKNKRKAELFAYLFALQSITGSIGSFFGGYLKEEFSMFLVFGVITLLYFLAFLSFLVFPLPEKKKDKEQEEKRHFFSGFSYFFTQPSLLFYFFLNTGSSLNWGVKIILWPLIIFELSQSETITGSIFATMGIVAFFALPFAGKFVDKVGYFKTVFCVYLILGICGIFLSTTSYLSVFWFFAAVFALGEALDGPTQASLLTENIPSQMRGEILAVDEILDTVISTLSPLFAGLLLEFLLPQSVLFLYIGVLWIFFILSIPLYIIKLRKN